MPSARSRLYVRRTLKQATVSNAGMRLRDLRRSIAYLRRNFMGESFEVIDEHGRDPTGCCIISRFVTPGVARIKDLSRQKYDALRALAVTHHADPPFAEKLRIRLLRQIGVRNVLLNHPVRVEVRRVEGDCVKHDVNPGVTPFIEQRNNLVQPSVKV